MMDHENRLGRVRDSLDELDVPALLVTNLTNVRYLTGFSGTNGQVLVSKEGAVFLSDPRYAARAGDLVQAAEIAIYPARLGEALVPRLKSLGARRLGVEASSMTLGQRADLSARLEDVELVPTAEVVERLRRSKSPEEVALIREAARVADEGFEWVVGRLWPGTTEREVALDLEVHMRKSGADHVSFDPIVGFGPLSAHIHHTPTERVLQRGDLVLLDFGARCDGYCSDLTRTVVLGRASDEQKQRYELVLQAQRVGIDSLEAGAAGVDVDARARQVIERAGYGEAFGHGLGHGVGLEVHEAPRLHRISEDELVLGDVVTVEPGVYITGEGGIRIEDCVLVGEHGAEVLGKAPKDSLLEL